MEFEDFYDFVIVVGTVTILEVIVFFGISLYLEFEEAVSLGDVEDDNILCIVAVFTGADLDLLEVAEVVVLGAAGEGDTGIEEVDEFCGAGEVVLGDGLPASAFRCVGYDYGCQVVFFLKSDEFHHKTACGGSFFGVVADECDVVYDEEFGALFGGFFDGVEDFLFEVGSDYEFGVDFGTGEVGWEDVDFSCCGVAVAHLKLLGGQFEIDVKDFLGPGYIFCNLNGEDRFAHIAGCKDNCVLELDDEVVEVHLWVRGVEAFFYPGVGGLDGKESYSFRSFLRFGYLG